MCCSATARSSRSARILHGDHECWMPRAATSCRVASTRTRISKCRSWAPIRPMISNPARARHLPAARRWWSISACRRRSNRCWRRLQMWDNKTSKRCLRLFLPYGHHMVGQAGLRRDGRLVVDKGITSFKHFMAYKGALMVDDDEMYASFQRCAAIWARLPHGACRKRRRRRSTHAQKLLADGNTGPEGHAYVAPAGSGRRGHQPRHHDCRHGRCAALCGAHLLRAGTRGHPPGAAEGHAGVSASRWSSI